MIMFVLHICAGITCKDVEIPVKLTPNQCNYAAPMIAADWRNKNEFGYQDWQIAGWKCQR